MEFITLGKYCIEVTLPSQGYPDSTVFLFH